LEIELLQSRDIGIFAIGAVLGVLTSTLVTAMPALPDPFTATYAVSFRGINGGTLQMDWRRDQKTGHYVFETRANPSTLARLFVSRDAIERTELEVTGDGVRPIRWEIDDGKSGIKGDGRLEFDWETNVATGTYEGKPVSLPLEPGMLDRQSIQIGAMTAMLRGNEPGTIAMVNGDNIRRYTYTRGSAEALETNLGKLDTIIYESTRPNSDRVSRVWHAPSLGYVPAKAEQVRKGKVETVMTLIDLKRGTE
jgi:Protein of unknown function (DUF3108)